MAVLEWWLILGVAGFIGFSVLNQVRTQEQERRLREAFYYLLETQASYVSLMQLATTARVDAEPAKAYLETQAKVFSTLPEVDADGDIFYRFPKIKRTETSPEPRSLPATDGDDWS